MTCCWLDGLTHCLRTLLLPGRPQHQEPAGRLTTSIVTAVLTDMPSGLTGFLADVGECFQESFWVLVLSPP